MIENSAQGLAMVDGDATVNVTREEEHQAILGRYPVAMAGQRQVAVELGWCTIASGKYRGQPAIEVRLDGHRVGELTFLMSQRYTPMLGDIVARQGRPGCVAVIRRGTNGLEMVLRLPRADAAAPIPVPQPAPAPTPAVVPSTFARHKIAWIAAGVVGLLLLIGTIANAGNDSPSTTNVVDLGATPTTTAAPTTTTTTAAPTPTTTTPPAPPAATPAAPAVPQVPATQAPPPQPKTTTKKTTTAAPPPPAPKPACDPNYSGCVPIATDVDCAGGSGNGPAYVQGPVQVIGSDIYGLDADHDGIGCERD